MSYFIQRTLLFITQSDHTGADLALIKAAHFLHEAGHKVQILVGKKTTQNPLVEELHPQKEIRLGEVIKEGNVVETLQRNLKYLFVSINEHIEYHNIDTILKHLRFNPQMIFVGSTPLFLTTKDIANLSEQTKAIVYNVALDMNHFTGGCHFAWDCLEYIKTGCENCPAIIHEEDKNIAKRNFNIKKEINEQYNFRLLAGTLWTKEQAEQSLLYRHQDWIPNTIGILDPNIYFPEHREIAKKFFNLDEDKFYILAGSENPLDERKGYKYFIEALQLLWDKLPKQQREKIVVLSIGKLQHTQNKEILFKRQHIEYIKDERLLVQLYKAADLFVNTSIEDSGPTMLIESLACGTPVVAFNTGAATQFIENGKSGFVVPNKNAKVLAESIRKVFNLTKKEHRKFGAYGSKKAMQLASKEQLYTTFNELFTYHHKELEANRTIETSVALCTYNGEEFIEEQLNSILNQNLPVHEIIICDDCSTDDTWNILKKYQKEYPGLIQLYQNEKNLHTVKNFEKAINLCTKEIVFLCDQDDIWFPNKTERVISAFKTIPNTQAVCHNLQLCTETAELINNTMWETLGFSTYIKKYRAFNPISYALFCGNMVTGAGFAFRKKKDTEIKFDDRFETIIHDYQLGLLYLHKKSLYFLDECLGLYRQHQKQQIGAISNKKEEHHNMIEQFYSNNLHWKIQFMYNRQKSEPIFDFIKNSGDLNLIREVNETHTNTIGKLLQSQSLKNKVKTVPFILRRTNFSQLQLLFIKVINHMLKR